MKTAKKEEIEAYLEAGVETRSVEFKVAFKWNDPAKIWLQEKVIAAILAMTNTPGGGVVLIGVKEDPFSVTGMDNDTLATFNEDDVRGVVGGYAETPLYFDMSAHEVSAGKKIVLFRVSEFDKTPVVCKKDGTHAFLRSGTIYARPKRGAFASTRASSIELDEMIDLAVDKRVASLRARGWTNESTANALASERGDF
jgi:predicted HTH transcriptional regulator